ADVDDRAGFARGHAGQNRLGAVEHALQVGIDLARIVVVVDRVERPRVGDAGVVDQAFDRPVCGFGRLDRGGDGGVVGDVAGALAPEAIAAVKTAWAQHLVLRFRGQRLADDDLLRFSRQFGELDWAPIAAARVKVPGEDRYVEAAPEGRQYVMVISNVIENGQAIGQLGAYEAVWHTDMSYIPDPPSASALYALEVPPEG